MQRRALLFALVLLAGVEALAQSPSPETGLDGYPKVLVIYSTRREAPYTVAVEGVLRQTISDGLARRLDYYTEYIDFSRFGGPDYQDTIREYLNRKYGGIQPDVIISDGGAAFEFFAKHRAELFPDVPLVFSTEKRNVRPIRNSTGVVYSLEMKKTLDIALRLNPDVKRVFVVRGASAFDRVYEQIAREQFREHEKQVAIEYLPPMALEKLRQVLATLPAGSIIYFASFFEDDAGHKFIPQHLLPELSRIANAPMYCWPEMTLGLGIVGGELLSERTVAQQAASLALRILGGESPDSVPNLEIHPYVRAFDWQQLRRWRISEARLPPDSHVRFKEQSFWSMYRSRIIAIVLVVAAQALLIVGLVVNRVRRGRAEREVRISHRRIEDLARSLIVAQEEERKHIARELHDDVSQQVAVLTINLTSLKRQLSGATDALQDQVAVLQKSAVRLSERVHDLSHDLHSTTLEHAGLASTIKVYCEELSEREGLAIDLEICGELGLVTADAALCLYRVAQEALRNTVKHSGATCVEVELTPSIEHIELRVSDHGRGFDQTQAAASGGLGLVSMEERVKLLGGTLLVRTQSGVGTALTARVPRGRQTPLVGLTDAVSVRAARA